MKRNINRLEIQQGENVVVFEFNRLHDLMEFAETCIECSDSMTVVTIYPTKEEE